MNDDGDIEQQQQEDRLFPWLADGSMADPPEEYYDAPEHDDGPDDEDEGEGDEETDEDEDDEADAEPDDSP